MNMHTEPIRLPAIVEAIVVFLAPVAVALLLGGDWRIALATAIGALVPAGGIVAVAESRRAFRESPATTERATREAWQEFDLHHDVDSTQVPGAVPSTRGDADQDGLGA